MKFDILSIFPHFFDSPLKESLVAKAIAEDKFSINIHNLRDFATSVSKQVDDTPYGGGAGMVLKPDVLSEAVKTIRQPKSKVILTDPGGIKFDQKLAEELKNEENLILIAGRYEGVDERFKQKYVDVEISIGDYILNGGEIACWVIFESIARLLPGVIGREESLKVESFSEQKINETKKTLLEYPQYTKPAVFEGIKVPDILLTGDHAKIEKWRQDQALEKTKKLRPDLLK